MIGKVGMLAGQQEALGRDLARLQAQLRGGTGGRPVQGFLEGLVGGLLLGAALALFAARRGTATEIEPLQEASIELKERPTQLANDARDGGAGPTEQADALTEGAKAALDRIVPRDKATEV